MQDDTPGGTPAGVTRLEGQLLGGRYRIEHVVSAGANTIVTEAIDTHDERPVTLKVVRPELAVTTEFRKAFRRQVEVAMSLDHPNIASVLGWGETDLDGETTLYWVVEYLGGGSLRDLFDRGRLLEPSQALVVGLEACRALDAAHARGVIHTELTPSKLLFGEDARLRIVDFAMAQLLGAEAWSEPATVATHVARYASPEQALSLDVDATTDVYALSLCLIEGVTGKVPFAGDSTVSTLAGRVGKLMPVTADMGSLASVLERAGRPDSDDRWTAAEFGRALVQAAETLPRPEPIPVMASSLFATSLASKAAAARADAAPVSDAVDDPAVDDPADDVTDVPAPDPVPASDPSAPLLPADASGDADADAAPVDDPAPVTAPVDPMPLLLLTDVADAPTGAVQVAETGSDEPSDPGSGGPTPTVEMPAPMSAVSAGAPPTTQMAAVDPTSSGAIYDEERSSRPWGKYALFSLVVLVGLGLLGTAAFLLLRTKSYEVPDLTDVEESVARNEISGNGWDIQTERERSDEVEELDHVIRTDPPAGEQLDEGATFVIYVSDGPELRTLPEFAGMTVEEANATLADLRLVAVVADAQYSETVPAGAVISWQVQDGETLDASLVAGSQVLPDTTVVLTPSLGPEPRPAPDLANLTAPEATAALDALQLVTAQAEDVFSNDIEAGRVVAQDPPATTPVERGGTVTFTLSKGPDLVPIPDLTGLSYPDAQAALEAAGYVVNSLLGTTEGVFFQIGVNGEAVDAGATFPRGTGVDLVFL